MGYPLSGFGPKRLNRAAQEKNEADASKKVQQALDPLCLLSVHINPESRVQGPQRMAKPQLVQATGVCSSSRWKTKVKVTSELRVSSPNETSARATTAAEKAQSLDEKQGCFAFAAGSARTCLLCRRSSHS
jgi:hypothetical protein